MKSNGSAFVNWLCAAFSGFVRMLALTLAVLLVGWVILGWLAAWMLWGSVNGDAALALWLACVIVGLGLAIKDRVELKLDQLDRRIESRAQAWKNR